MSTIGKLFGRSPFGQIQMHMDHVSKCVHKMQEAIEAMTKDQFEELDDLAYEVSRLEHHADEVKNDIRNHLLRRFFLPIDKAEVLDILSLQDKLADTAEDVCKVITLKKLPFHDGVAELFSEFVDLNLQAFSLVASIISQLDELIESGFGGAEAEKIRSLAHDVAVAEHKADVVQVKLLKKIYENDENMSIGQFHLWMRVTRILSRISNDSENLANKVLKTLSFKH